MGVITWIGAAVAAVLDSVAPLRARSERTKSRSPESLPLLPSAHALLGSQVVTLMHYKDPAVQDLVHSLKYDRSGHAARLAATVLADYLLEEIAAARLFSAKKNLLVPVPLHKSRARERGFNQIALVLDALPRELTQGPAAALAPALLERTRATTPQTRLSRRERLKNVAGAFSTPSADLSHARIFLIDDVTTTGATLMHAADPLQKAGAEVLRIALSRA